MSSFEMGHHTIAILLVGIALIQQTQQQDTTNDHDTYTDATTDNHVENRHVTDPIPKRIDGRGKSTRISPTSEPTQTDYEATTLRPTNRHDANKLDTRKRLDVNGNSESQRNNEEELINRDVHKRSRTRKDNTSLRGLRVLRHRHNTSGAHDEEIESQEDGVNKSELNEIGLEFNAPRTEEVNEAVEYGLKLMHDLYYVKEPLLYQMGFFLDPKEPAAKVAAFSAPNPKAMQQAQFGYVTVQASLKLAQKYRENPSRETPEFFDILRAEALADRCPLRGSPRCPPASNRYRTSDGTCNNFKHPWRGSSMTPMQRFLPPMYEDGVQSPKLSVFGDALPSPREISVKIHTDRDRPMSSVTLMFMQWGQFLDHDVTSTAQSRAFNGTVPMCCLPGGRGFLPSEFTHPECLPISVSHDDWFFGRFGIRCMEFVRSAPSTRINCDLGWREQLNQVTSYIDGSMIYGSDAQKAESLRTFRNGRLQYGQDRNRRRDPPDDDICRRGAVTTSCFLGGDGRFGEQPALTALHTIWLRYHNKLAGGLQDLNSHWSDEKVYQEARRIVGALIQHVTYREFLPIVLGQDVVDLFQLGLARKGYFDQYDPTANPTPANSFSSSAFRFGHSLVQTSFVRATINHRSLLNNVSLHHEQENPENIWSVGSVDRLILGLCNQPSQRRDEFISEELTNHLFQSGNSPFGMDLAAVNIQRGRDHGIPNYTAWREPCGLNPVTDWSDLRKVMSMESTRRFRSVYQDVDDIDLYSGGLAEKPVRGGVVGPTFACIIAQQFANFRKGDRFWYENGGFESSFTPAQLQHIRRVSLSQIICHSIDEIDTIQPFVFLSGDDFNNAKVSCNDPSIDNFDLFPWAEVEFNSFRLDRFDNGIEDRIGGFDDTNSAEGIIFDLLRESRNIHDDATVEETNEKANRNTKTNETMGENTRMFDVTISDKLDFTLEATHAKNPTFDYYHKHTKDVDPNSYDPQNTKDVTEQRIETKKHVTNVDNDSTLQGIKLTEDNIRQRNPDRDINSYETPHDHNSPHIDEYFDNMDDYTHNKQNTHKQGQTDKANRPIELHSNPKTNIDRPNPTIWVDNLDRPRHTFDPLARTDDTEKADSDTTDKLTNTLSTTLLHDFHDNLDPDNDERTRTHNQIVQRTDFDHPILTNGTKQDETYPQAKLADNTGLDGDILIFHKSLLTDDVLKTPIHKTYKIQTNTDRQPDQNPNLQVNINIQYVLPTTASAQPLEFHAHKPQSHNGHINTKPIQTTKKPFNVNHGLTSNKPSYVLNKPNSNPIYVINKPNTYRPMTQMTTKNPNDFDDVPVFVSKPQADDYYVRPNRPNRPVQTTVLDVDFDPVYEDDWTTKRPYNRPKPILAPGTFTVQGQKPSFATNRPHTTTRRPQSTTNKLYLTKRTTRRPPYNPPTRKTTVRPIFPTYLYLQETDDNNRPVLKPVGSRDPIDDAYAHLINPNDHTRPNFGQDQYVDFTTHFTDANPNKHTFQVHNIDDKLDFKSNLLPARIKDSGNKNFVKISSVQGNHLMKLGGSEQYIQPGYLQLENREGGYDVVVQSPSEDSEIVEIDVVPSEVTNEKWVIFNETKDVTKPTPVPDLNFNIECATELPKPMNISRNVLHKH